MASLSRIYTLRRRKSPIQVYLARAHPKRPTASPPRECAPSICISHHISCVICGECGECVFVCLCVCVCIRVAAVWVRAFVGVTPNRAPRTVRSFNRATTTYSHTYSHTSNTLAFASAYNTKHKKAYTLPL